MKMILDAMGGDLAPAEPIRGALLARKEFGCSIALVGRENQLRAALEKDGITLPPGVDIVNASEVVEICDDPATAWKKKKDSSLSVGLRMLKDGEGDAFISAGSTGALLSAATLMVKRIPGIRRAAVAPVIPTAAGGAVLIDAGANAECTAEYMLQFAFMGSFYAEKMLGRANPTVGLVNIGSEPTKGSELYKQVHSLLTDADRQGRIHFAGNVEPTVLAETNCCDVLVADGFVGNILLKSLEGTGKFLLHQLRDAFTANMGTKLGYLMVKNNLSGMKKLLDARETGGTALLGIEKPVFKAHGNSDAYAFCNAVKQAIRFADAGIIPAIEANMDYMVIPAPERAE